MRLHSFFSNLSFVLAILLPATLCLHDPGLSTRGTKSDHKLHIYYDQADPNSLFVRELGNSPQQLTARIISRSNPPGAPKRPLGIVTDLLIDLDLDMLPAQAYDNQRPIPIRLPRRRWNPAPHQIPLRPQTQPQSVKVSKAPLFGKPRSPRKSDGRKYSATTDLKIVAKGAKVARVSGSRTSGSELQRKGSSKGSKVANGNGGKERVDRAVTRSSSRGLSKSGSITSPKDSRNGSPKRDAHTSPKKGNAASSKRDNIAFPEGGNIASSKKDGITSFDGETGKSSKRAATY